MTGDSLTIKNLSNGAEHTVPPKLWETLKNDPIYELVETPKPQKSAKKTAKPAVKTEKKAPASRKTAKTK